MVCQICKQSLSQADYPVSCENCLKEFHGKELAEWLQTKNICPNCKAEFDSYFVFQLTDIYDITIGDLDDQNFPQNNDETDLLMRLIGVPQAVVIFIIFLVALIILN